MRQIIVGFGIFLFLSSCGENNQTTAEETDNPLKETTNQNGPVASEDVPAESSGMQYGHEVVVSDLQIPWGMDFLPDGGLLITEKSGEIILFQDGEKQQIQSVPEVYNRGQGGLLDLVVHPDYDSNGWIYITYSSSEGSGEGGNTALMRAKLENGQLTQKEQLYKATPNSTRGQHFGSRIIFDDQGFVYFTVGDRGARDENPQDLSRDGGKVYRLNDDGTIPEDNPFVGQENAIEAVFSYGHRNPQGMIFNSDTGEIWLHEHGPQGGDEINVVEKGANYGWPEVTYGINYDSSPITDETTGPEYQGPVFYWDPSIAPSGMLYVTSDKYPELKGNLLIGSLKFQYVEHLQLDGKTVVKREKLLEQLGRVRNIVQGPDGYIYISLEGTGIVRLLNPQEAE